MNRYAVLRITRSLFEGMKYQVRYKSWNMINKLPTISPIPDSLEIKDVPQKRTSKSEAMKAYLNRVENYNKFMTQETLAYDIGKRHLANMMGQDPETFTQEDINEAIAYLFPCSLYEPRARPMMKPPHEIFPPKKEAEFDESGRPYHFLFYTTKPRFYQILHDSAKILRKLDEIEDKIIRGEENNAKYTTIPLDASSWISKDDLEAKFQEVLNDKEYAQLKIAMERIAHHPCGSEYADFLHQFCFPLTEKHAYYELYKPETLKDGRQRILIPNIKRKLVNVNVEVIYPGSGQFLIDGKNIQVFCNFQSRTAILYPLVLTNMVKKVDVDVRIVQPAANGGDTITAHAIRVGVSRGLYYFVDDITKDKLKLAGLLNIDIRLKERKRPGQEGARRKFTWRKR